MKNRTFCSSSELSLLSDACARDARRCLARSRSLANGLPAMSFAAPSPLMCSRRGKMPSGILWRAAFDDNRNRADFTSATAGSLDRGSLIRKSCVTHGTPPDSHCMPGSRTCTPNRYGAGGMPLCTCCAAILPVAHTQFVLTAADHTRPSRCRCLLRSRPCRIQKPG